MFGKHHGFYSQPIRYFLNLFGPRSMDLSFLRNTCFLSCFHFIWCNVKISIIIIITIAYTFSHMLDILVHICWIYICSDRLFLFSTIHF